MTSEIQEILDAGIFDKAAQAYSALEPIASFVAGTPYETPLRWQKVSGMGSGGPAGELARYLMIDFGDDRQATVYKNYYPETRSRRPWELNAHIPRQDGSYGYINITIQGGDGRRMMFDVLPMTFFGNVDFEVSHGFRRGNQSDIDLFSDMLDEAMVSAPQRQLEFVGLLELERAEAPIHYHVLSGLKFTDYREITDLCKKSDITFEAQELADKLRVAIGSVDTDVIVARDNWHQVVAAALINSQSGFEVLGTDSTKFPELERDFTAIITEACRRT